MSKSAAAPSAGDRDSEADANTLRVDWWGRYMFLQDAELHLRQIGRGCILFEAKAENDITIGFNDRMDGTFVSQDGQTQGATCYEVIIGGWLNTKSAIRKRGQQQTCAQKRTQPDSVISSKIRFERYWINLYDGVITVGKGEPGTHEFMRWADSDPLPNVRYVAVTAWNTPVYLRDIRVVSGFRPTPPNALLSPHANLHRMLGNQDTSDLTFVIGSARIPAHRLVLAAASPYFFRMFRDNPASSHPEIVLDDPEITPDLWMEFLAFVYTGYLNMSEHGTSSSAVGRVSIFSKLARQYEMEELHNLCSRPPADPYAHIAKGLANYRQFLGRRFLSDVDIVYDAHYVSALQEQLSSESCQQIHAETEGVQTTQLKYAENPNLVDIFQQTSHSAHRVLLACWSEPLYAMFASPMIEKRQRNVRISDADPRIFAHLLHFMYTAELDLNQADYKDDPDSYLAVVISLLELGTRYCIDLLRSLLCDRLEALIAEDNCCRIYYAAQLYQCNFLANVCLKYISRMFLKIFGTHEFLSLDFASFSTILRRDDLAVSSEAIVWDAVLDWISQRNHSSSSSSSSKEAQPVESYSTSRLPYLTDLLDIIRFPLFSQTEMRHISSSILPENPMHLFEEFHAALCQMLPPYLKTALATQSGKDGSAPISSTRASSTALLSSSPTASSPPSSLMSSSPLQSSGSLFKIFENSISFHSNTNPGADFRLTKRRNPSLRPLVFSSAGDENGACFYAGTGYNRAKQWTNPHTLGTVKVTSSSFPSRYTKPEYLVDRTYRTISFTTARTGQFAWWAIDFGPDHALICNHYVLRHDGTRTTFLRNWRLEASSDKTEWATLREHRNDLTLSAPGQFAAWPVEPTLPYRHFRIYNMDDGPLVLMSFEFYGQFM